MTPGQLRSLQAAHDANCQPVAALGYSWPSQAAAARDLGVFPTVISRSLKRGTFEALVRNKISAAAGLLPRGRPSRGGSAVEPRQHEGVKA